MKTTCLSHPNHPTPNTLPVLQGRANLSVGQTPRKGRQGVAGFARFGSIRMIQSPFNMSFT